MAYTYLEFEKPISDLENKIESLRDNKDNDESVHQEISSLSNRIENLTKEIYEGLSIWQKVQVARHPHRPHFSDYIENIFTDFDELHGDRLFGDDQAIIGGLAKFKGSPVVIIGHEKGKSTEDKISRNFGMSQPEGYRKAARLMKLAEDFSLPIITFIDTPGAYPGIESEERGMSEAIAKNLSIMSGLKVPIIVIYWRGWLWRSIGDWSRRSYFHAAIFNLLSSIPRSLRVYCLERQFKSSRSCRSNET